METLAKEGRILFEQKYSILKLGEQFRKHILELVE
jgi:hypothetical protein